MPETIIRDTTPAAPVLSSQPEPAGGAGAERERVLGIQQGGRVLGLQRMADEMVTRGIGLEAARTALFNAATERDEADAIAGNRGATVRGGFSGEDPEHIRTAMADALTARITRSQPSEQAREWMTHSIIDLGRQCLEMRGIRAPRQPAEVWTRIGGLHTTSDFALLLADAQGKSLRLLYEAAPSGIRAAARQTTARDFKNVHRLQAGEFPMPLLVGEHGEFTRGTMGESDETYSLATYGRVFGISRQAIINDDLSVFMSLANRMAVASAEFVAQQIAILVEANPVMATDGNELFHTDHGNLKASASGPPSVTTVGAARAGMRAHKGLDGEVFIRADPRYLIVPPALETVAEQLTVTLTPSTTSEANPFAGRITPLVEPRLTSTTAWYLSASPDQIDGLEYAFLDGAEGPQTETRIGFDVDGVETKLRIDFGAGWLDYRGWYRDDGVN